MGFLDEFTNKKKKKCFKKMFYRYSLLVYPPCLGPEDGWWVYWVFIYVHPGFDTKKKIEKSVLRRTSIGGEP